MAKEIDTTSRLNNKINEDGVKESPPGQYQVRQELKDKREYPWGSGKVLEIQAGNGGWGVPPLGLGSAWGRSSIWECRCTCEGK